LSVVIGGQELSWDAIVHCSRFLVITHWCMPLTVLFAEARGLSKKGVSTQPTVPTIGTMPGRFAEGRYYQNSLSLQELLSYGRELNATDKKDHVYAVLGLGKRRETGWGIVPDYHKGVTEVYVDAAWAILEDATNLDLLSHVEDSFYRTISDLPSWVPDWTTVLVPIPMHGYLSTNKRWNAAKMLQFKCATRLANSRLLSVTGIQIDSIVEFACVLRELSYGWHRTDSVLKLALALSTDIYCTGESKLDALARTIVADTHDAAPQDLIVLFCHWLVGQLNLLFDETRKLKESEQSDKSQIEIFETLAVETHQVIEALINEDEKNIPKLSIDDALERWNSREANEREPLQSNWLSFLGSVSKAYGARRLFRTNDNYLGLTALSQQVGDQIWLIGGCNMPIVLRPLENGNFALVGEAYVHGIMDGSANVEPTLSRNIFIE